MFENIHNPDSIPTPRELEFMETEATPGIVKFVIVFTVAMTVANVALMKFVALGG